MAAGRVLVADDDAELRDLLAYYLRKLGHEVVAVDNGCAALEAIARESFDLVLLDVMMPGLDGYHVAARIAEQLGDKRPKILIITSRDTGDEKVQALISGSDGSIQKPFKLADVKAKVAEVLGLVKE